MQQILSQHEAVSSQSTQAAVVVKTESSMGDAEAEKKESKPVQQNRSATRQVVFPLGELMAYNTIPDGHLPVLASSVQAQQLGISAFSDARLLKVLSLIRHRLVYRFNNALMRQIFLCHTRVIRTTM